MQPALIQQVMEPSVSLIWAGDPQAKTGQKAVCWLPGVTVPSPAQQVAVLIKGRSRNLSTGVCSRRGTAVLQAVWMNSVWVCLSTRGEFLKEKEWRNLEEEGSRSYLDSKGFPGASMAAQVLCLTMPLILRKKKASLGDTWVQRDMHENLPDILLFCVYAHASPFKIATPVFH